MRRSEHGFIIVIVGVVLLMCGAAPAMYPQPGASQADAYAVHLDQTQQYHQAQADYHWGQAQYHQTQAGYHEGHAQAHLQAAQHYYYQMGDANQSQYNQGQMEQHQIAAQQHQAVAQQHQGEAQQHQGLADQAAQALQQHQAVQQQATQHQAVQQQATQHQALMYQASRIAQALQSRAAQQVAQSQQSASHHYASQYAPTAAAATVSGPVPAATALTLVASAATAPAAASVPAVATSTSTVPASAAAALVASTPVPTQAVALVASTPAPAAASAATPAPAAVVFNRVEHRAHRDVNGVVAQSVNSFFCSYLSNVDETQVYSSSRNFVNAPLFHNYNSEHFDMVFAATKLPLPIFFSRLPQPIQGLLKTLGKDENSPDVEIFYVLQSRGEGTPILLRPQYWCFPQAQAFSQGSYNLAATVDAILLSAGGLIPLENPNTDGLHKATDTITLHAGAAASGGLHIVVASGNTLIMKDSGPNQANHRALSLWSIVRDQTNGHIAVTLHQILVHGPQVTLQNTVLGEFCSTMNVGAIPYHPNPQPTYSFNKIVWSMNQVKTRFATAAQMFDPLLEDIQGLITGQYPNAAQYDAHYGANGSNLHF